MYLQNFNMVFLISEFFKSTFIWAINFNNILEVKYPEKTNTEERLPVNNIEEAKSIFKITCLSIIKDLSIMTYRKDKHKPKYDGSAKNVVGRI